MDENNDKKSGFLSFLQRQPFAIVGAFGLVAIIDGFINIPGYIGQWVDAWQTITRPVWEFLFGWIFEYFKITMPWWVKDYLTMGLIAAGMEVRSTIYDRQFLKNGFPNNPLETRTPIYSLYLSSLPNQWLKFYFVALPLLALDDFIRWPIRIIQVFLRYTGIYKPDKEHTICNWQEHKKDADSVYFETVLYALILIALAYASTKW